LHYDAIVVGAGPGGCMAARVLSRAGFKVLLVERETLPREKACGGVLLPEALEAIRDAYGPLPAACLAEDGKGVKGARLLCEGGGDYLLPFSGEGAYAVRSRLDAFLAGESGAELLDGCEVTGLEVGRFRARVRLQREGRGETAESTYLVGADGAESLVLRALRPEFHRLYAQPALERSMLLIAEAEMEWDPQWVGLALPRGGRGLGRFFRREGLVFLAVSGGGESGWRGELEGLLSFLGERVGMELRGEPVRRSVVRNRMGINGNYSLGAGCALLVGEAAGLLDPWGFGIHLALESGRIAAESIVESAGENVTPHLRYRYRMQPVLERESGWRRRFYGKVGALDTSALKAGGGFAARRDRRALRRRI